MTNDKSGCHHSDTWTPALCGNSTWPTQPSHCRATRFGRHMDRRIEAAQGGQVRRLLFVEASHYCCLCSGVRHAIWSAATCRSFLLPLVLPSKSTSVRQIRSNGIQSDDESPHSKSIRVLICPRRWATCGRRCFSTRPGRRAAAGQSGPRRECLASLAR